MRVRGVTRRDKIRNTQIRQDVEVPSLMEFIEQRQLSWWGHLQRMENSRPVKQVWEAKTHKKKKREEDHVRLGIKLLRRY